MMEGFWRRLEVCMAISSRVSGGLYASRDEGEEKQNKLLALDLSVEEIECKSSFI